MPRSRRKLQDNSSNTAGIGCLLVFALPFAGAGVFMTGWVVRDVMTYQAVQTWVERPATLLEAELETHHDSEGGTTHEATARYRYEYQGQRYESTRVGLHTGADNIGSYQRDIGRELERLKRGGRPITAFVNPAAPNEAMLYRDLRPGFLAFKAAFGLIFGLVGFVLLGAGWFGSGQMRRQEKLKQQYGDEPWRWRDDWLEGRLRTHAGPAWFAAIFAIIWNLISWPAIIGAATSGGVKLPILLLVALFPLVGLGLAAWAAYLWLQRWKWGVSAFEMAAVPGVLGGPLAGVVRAPRRIDAEDGFTLCLACVRSVKEGKHPREDALWESEKRITRDLSTGDRTIIPVQFLIPYDLPDSGQDDVKWKLTVRAATSGVDYCAQFEVPVFRTAASSPTPPQGVEEERLELFAPLSLSLVAQRAGAVIEEDLPDRKVLYFPMARNRGMAVTLTLFTLIWLGVGTGLLYSPAPRPVAWGIVLLGVLLVWLTAYIVLERIRLEYGQRGVAFTRAILGGGGRRQFSPEEVKRIKAEPSGTTSNGHAYWNVVLQTADGQEHKLATELRCREHAEFLANEISTAAGLSQSRSARSSSRMTLDAELPSSMRRE